GLQPLIPAYSRLLPHQRAYEVFWKPPVPRETVCGHAWTLLVRLNFSFSGVRSSPPARRSQAKTATTAMNDIRWRLGLSQRARYSPLLRPGRAHSPANGGSKLADLIKMRINADKVA